MVEQLAIFGGTQAKDLHMSYRVVVSHFALQFSRSSLSDFGCCFYLFSHGAKKAALWAAKSICHSMVSVLDCLGPVPKERTLIDLQWLKARRAVLAFILSNRYIGILAMTSV